MVLVDNRAGSKGLVKPLQHLGLSVCETTLDFGDVAFQGRGEGGKTLDIGIEYKQLSELVQSLRSGRLVGHQLPGMQAAYDHRWLVIEGEWKQDSKGLVCVPKRRGRWEPVKPRITASELEKQLLTLQMCGGINVRFTLRLSDTLRVLVTLYRWFSDSALDAHSSHIAIYRPAPLIPISDTQAILNSIPDVGLKLSGAAERKFKTVRDAVNASISDWASLETKDAKGNLRRLGMKTAAKIDKILGGE